MNNADDVLHERDMPRNQYSLVDTCFEEGQYEAGIAVLNDLRDSKYKPLP
jgi:pentatricopeptide repeat protein